jgi:hypothetical protein
VGRAAAGHDEPDAGVAFLVRVAEVKLPRSTPALACATLVLAVARPAYAGAGMPAYVALVFAALLLGVVGIVAVVLVVQRLLGVRTSIQPRSRRMSRLRQAMLFLGAGAIGIALQLLLLPDDPIGPGTLIAFAAFLLLAAFVPTDVLAPRIRAFIQRHRDRVTVDEGGVRLQRGWRRRYIPFDRIADARIAAGAFGAPRLEIVEHDGRADGVRTSESPSEVLGAILDRVHPFAPAPAAAQAFARAGRSLADWRRAIDAQVGGGHLAYRDGAASLEQLATVVGDAHVDPELRAGVAYALLTSGIPEGREAVAATLGRAPPPILVAMAAAAPGGAEIVAREDVVQAESYLGDMGSQPPRHLRVSDEPAAVRVTTDGDGDMDAAAEEEATDGAAESTAAKGK